MLFFILPFKIEFWGASFFWGGGGVGVVFFQFCFCLLVWLGLFHIWNIYKKGVKHGNNSKGFQARQSPTPYPLLSRMQDIHQSFCG